MLPNISVLWFVDCADPVAELRAGADIDPAKTTDFMEHAFADTALTPIGTSDLAAAVDGADNRVFAAHFGRLAVLAGASLSTADPDELASYLSDLGVGRTWVLISIDPSADTGCLARWENGELQRAFAGTSTSINVDVGLPHPFEGPYWAGEHPQPAAAAEPLALPFHPGALADAANRAWFGFGFHESEPQVEPALIPVTVYRLGPDDGRDQYIETSVPLGRAASDQEVVETSLEASAEASPAASTEADPIEALVTEPIHKVDAPPAAWNDTVEAPPERAPGPLSRYFGFRGRL